jgi:hypothetical protein
VLNAKHQPEWVRPLHLLPILSRPTQNRDRGTQGRGLHRHPRMAPAALTSSPIDRTARNTAELDRRNTTDRTLALSGPRQRNALSIHAPQSGSTDSWSSSTPMRVSQGQTSRAHSLCRDHYQARLSCAPGAHQSCGAACNRALLDPFSRSRGPKPACRAVVQLVQVPPRTQTKCSSQHPAAAARPIVVAP